RRALRRPGVPGYPYFEGVFLMQITVEFFGIPRQRAGCAEITLSLPACNDQATLGEILIALARELPDFGRECLGENRLQPGYIANLNGERFLSYPHATIAAGDTLLILSADVGG